MVDRGRTSPAALTVLSALFAVWSAVLVFSPGGSSPVEWSQLFAGVASTGFGLFALIKDDPQLNRMARYLLLAYAVAGAVIVFGLAADQRSSRTWARLGWAALVLGYLGSLVAWWRIPERRAATLVLGGVGAVVILGGIGIVANCDKSVQKTWCDPVFEREEALADEIVVDGSFLNSGRAGVIGAAVVIYQVAGTAMIPEVTHPPGEWDYEDRPLQSNETQRGRFSLSADTYEDCEIDAKVETPTGNAVLTLFVRCGVVE